MRIFYAASHSPNSIALPESDIWRSNLRSALTELGHEVVDFDYNLEPHFQHLDIEKPEDQQFIAQARPRLEAALLDQVSRVHQAGKIDLFFSYFYSACVRPEMIEAIRNLGMTTVNFYCNAIHQFHLVSDIAPAYDYCLVPEQAAISKYVAVGAHPKHMQMAANPTVYRPYDLPRQYDVTFVGQRYGDRVAYVDFLYRNGIDIRVWGPGWIQSQSEAVRSSRGRQRLQRLLSPQGPALIYRKLREVLSPAVTSVQQETVLPDHVLGPTLTDQELIEMYSRSKISVGFSGVTQRHSGTDRSTHIRLRDFEAPMSGALYLVEYQQELEQYYEIGKEIACYTDKYDLLQKVRYYLQHPDEAENIRSAGRDRALKEHTWKRRFEEFLGNLPGSPEA